MVVQVIAAKVGEQAAFEADSIQSTLVESMGRCFHCHSGE